MESITREQFKRKYAADHSVKNFLINDVVNSKLRKERVNTQLVRDCKVTALAQASSDEQREEGFNNLVFDGIAVKQTEVLDMDIKDLMSMGLKLIEGKHKKQDSGMTVNFSFGALAKQCYEQPDKVETIDI